ncbi:DUF106 domain-containing protein [Candidatus Pacearchaeota archaeon]|nr:DUF106 domain-containing protein [Candidatus Pacearchaeota archaeon]
MVFDNLLNPVLGPLLKLPSLLAVFILSFGISLIITLIYKFATNQSLMKDLKDEMKAFQNQIKELRSEPQKAMEVQKKAMKTNMKYMSHSMKSTLFTFIPIIIIFGWMNTHLAFDPIMPGQDFTTSVYFEEGADGEISLNALEGIFLQSDAHKKVEGEVSWILNGEEGEYLIEYEFNGNKYFKEVLITTENEYRTPVKSVKDGNINRIEIKHDKNIVLNLFGWKLGWLGTYIILSIIFSMVLRKMMKIY